MTARFSLLNALLLLSSLLLQPKGIHGGFREGFSSKVGNEAKNKMKDEAGALNGMTREMFLMKDKEWELQPVDFSCIKNLKLRRHCQKFLNRPVHMKLSARKGKYGLRAQGQSQSGKRLRGFWRQTTPSAKGEDLLKIGYDEAVKQRLTSVEFEIQLPPVSKKSRKLPTVIYSIVVEPGSMNPKAIVPRGAGTVRILPDGHGDGEDVNTLTIGKAFVTQPMRSGIVDPGWAKGRLVFRKGRPTGVV
ncbi:hypothetical protein FRACYDRAFT_237263 [Fragilariopsis cylindrus CCMP1102]|jgi:hypothetical protein|uniref:Uncharacterized protein n=1 Tax=Fragilariopsis cylindrus CCMP1102 TaxID=635003 RepID=A0A1E7FLL7_9STRA|nr:hypothetical protein FRACYDRAFT_237263 [Fragilariopsis cylindrus CCMP1102]|eukprot:OEU18975.1 hypothetical protein FRACYDRAFT_237263 [Fragilariopsis cylindrus CCMP1102]